MFSPTTASLWERTARPISRSSNSRRCGPFRTWRSTARAIRSMNGPNRSTPILALSADVLPEHILATGRAGMNGHIGKPIVPAELIGAVARWAAAPLPDPAEAAA